MKPYRFVDAPTVVKFIQAMDDETLEYKDWVMGFLYIEGLNMAADEMMYMTNDRYIDYLLNYIL